MTLNYARKMFLKLTPEIIATKIISLSLTVKTKKTGTVFKHFKFFLTYE